MPIFACSSDRAHGPDRNRALLGQAASANFEVWGYNQTAFAQEGRIDVMRTYPDRGHGSFCPVRPATANRDDSISGGRGRWLVDSDVDALVLTMRTIRDIPEAKIGDRILLSIAGRPTAWRLVGVVQEVGGGGGYVSSAGYAKATGSLRTGSDIRLIASARTAEERDRVVRAAERALDEAGIGLEEACRSIVNTPPCSATWRSRRMLIAASLVIALVGGLGLASMMTVNVLERTREIGVMKAIGAYSGQPWSRSSSARLWLSE